MAEKWKGAAKAAEKRGGWPERAFGKLGKIRPLFPACLPFVRPEYRCAQNLDKDALPKNQCDRPPGNCQFVPRDP